MAALTIVLGKQVFDLTGSELDLGLLGLAEFAPSALLVFVTGPLADRFDRRRIAATGIVFEAIFVLALAWYAGTDPTSTLPIFLLVIGYGTARAFAFPASRALPADTVPATRLPWLVRTSVDQLAGGVDPRAGHGWFPLCRRRAAPLPRRRGSALGRCDRDLARATHLPPRAGACRYRSRRD